MDGAESKSVEVVQPPYYEALRGMDDVQLMAHALQQEATHYALRAAQLRRVDVGQPSPRDPSTSGLEAQRCDFLADRLLRLNRKLLATATQ